MKILVLNGPNLNLLGQRDHGHYGEQSWNEIEAQLKSSFPQVNFSFHQCNHEGELVQEIQEAQNEQAGIILNAGGFTHTSIAIADAIAAIKLPVVEVHMSKLARREAGRQHSVISKVCAGYIDGLGADSYKMGIEHLIYLTQEA